jgi:hypothetical protein
VFGAYNVRNGAALVAFPFDSKLRTKLVCNIDIGFGIAIFAVKLK